MAVTPEATLPRSSLKPPPTVPPAPRAPVERVQAATSSNDAHRATTAGDLSQIAPSAPTPPASTAAPARKTHRGVNGGVKRGGRTAGSLQARVTRRSPQSFETQWVIGQAALIGMQEKMCNDPRETAEDQEAFLQRLDRKKVVVLASRCFALLVFDCILLFILVGLVVLSLVMFCVCVCV